MNIARNKLIKSKGVWVNTGCRARSPGLMLRLRFGEWAVRVSAFTILEAWLKSKEPLRRAAVPNRRPDSFSSRCNKQRATRGWVHLFTGKPSAQPQVPAGSPSGIFPRLPHLPGTSPWIWGALQVFAGSSQRVRHPFQILRRADRLGLAGPAQAPEPLRNPGGPRRWQRLDRPHLRHHPFPTNLTQWKYRAIYRVDDSQVGQWSSEASVNVGG